MSNNVFNQRDFNMTQANKITGAEIVIKALIDQGVDTVFGYPGGAILPIYDERIITLLPQKKNISIFAFTFGSYEEGF